VLFALHVFSKENDSTRAVTGRAGREDGVTDDEAQSSVSRAN